MNIFQEEAEVKVQDHHAPNTYNLSGNDFKSIGRLAELQKSFIKSRLCNLQE